MEQVQKVINIKSGFSAKILKHVNAASEYTIEREYKFWPMERNGKIYLFKEISNKEIQNGKAFCWIVSKTGKEVLANADI